MKTTLYFLVALMAFGLGACNKFKTDATTGREFLLRQGPKTQYFGPGVTQFSGEKGMSFDISDPFMSLETGDTIVGNPEFWLIEYKDKKDMMFSGVPTISNNQIIATGGAFKLTARINGELVRPEHVDFFVPNPTNNPQMEAFFANSDSTSFWNLDPWGFIYPLFGVGWNPDTVLNGIGQSGYQGYVNPIADYFFSNGSMSINCDYFPSWGIPLTDISVRPSAEVALTPIQNDVSLLFDSLEVYMPGQWNSLNSGYSFTNVPTGYNVTCLAVGVDNNQELYFGMLDFEIEENGVYTFQMDPITEEELEDILDGL